MDRSDPATRALPWSARKGIELPNAVEIQLKKAGLHPKTKDIYRQGDRVSLR